MLLQLKSQINEGIWARGKTIKTDNEQNAKEHKTWQQASNNSSSSSQQQTNNSNQHRSKEPLIRNKSAVFIHTGNKQLSKLYYIVNAIHNMNRKYLTQRKKPKAEYFSCVILLLSLRCDNFMCFICCFVLKKKKKKNKFLSTFSLDNLGCNRVTNYLFQYAKEY